MTLDGIYYDGRTTRQHAVSLRIDAAGIDLRGDGVARRAALSDVRISEALASVPRLLRFADGAYCEVAESPQLRAHLAAAGYREGQVQRWQSSLRAAVAALLLLVLLVFAGYRWGLPHAATFAAAQVPEPVAAHLAQRTLDVVDAGLAQPSALDAPRRAQLEEHFRRLVHGRALPSSTRLLFRASPAFGANAFALPDGTVVLFDELVALAERDEQIVAVLAHELGYVERRHGMQLLLRNTVVGAAMLLWLGDISSLLAAAPTVLLNASYSRELESEADRYAADLLRAHGIPARHLADMLERLAGAHERSAGADYLSSHPAPEQRIRALRRMP
ncbi:MAG: M48 family metallopeptidase [Gammaproteobacteria bacterium]